MTTVFGPVKTGTMIRRAAEGIIKLWEPTYREMIGGIYELELPPIRSYSAALSSVMEKAVEEQLPACVIMTPGTIDVPQRYGRGISIRWSLGIGVVVSGVSIDNTLMLAEAYAAIIRMILTQQRDPTRVITGIDWTGERYDELGAQRSRTLASAMVQFRADVESVLDPVAGPSTPDDTDLHIAETVDMEVRAL